jgi:hypothetical protein
MMLAPYPQSTAADLARVLACWLAVIVFLLGIGGAQALGRGPLHRHVESLAAAQHHHHDEAERHHHEAQDLSVLEVANAQDNVVDAGAFALAAALALMAVANARAWRETRRHVWRPAPSWAWRTHIANALRKPPRQG